MAKLAEQAERYEEMVEFMEKVAKTVEVEELTVEERNLLSVAYKNVIGARRASWRIISSIEQKEESRGNEDHVAIIKEYRGKIETELSKICDGILNLLESNLIPSAQSPESKVFYLKMKGDYHRYLAEFKTGAERKDAAESTLLAYKSAQVYILFFILWNGSCYYFVAELKICVHLMQDIALADLAPTHPIRLGLALNFSVFYYEILNSPDRACNLAKQVYLKPFNCFFNSLLLLVCLNCSWIKNCLSCRVWTSVFVDWSDFLIIRCSSSCVSCFIGICCVHSPCCIEKSVFWAEQVKKCVSQSHSRCS